MAVRNKYLTLLFSLVFLAAWLLVPSAGWASQPRLGLGSRGEAVTELQNLLKTAGFYPDQPSGYFGMTTLVALTEFQEKQHLTVNGVCGVAEWDALAAAPVASGTGKIVLGYYVNDYSGDVASYDSVLQFGGDVTYTATVSYEANSDGSLSGQVPQQGLGEIKQAGSTPLLLLNNLGDNGPDAWSIHALMNSKTATKAFYSNVLYLLSTYGYKGVNIDFEGLWPQDRDLFSAFLTGLKAQLAPHGYLLSVSVPAKAYDQPNDAWGGAYDYPAIGRTVDLVALMTYDQHWYGGSPGPVAALPWVKNCLSYATSTIPADKILLGIAAYGYNWSSSNTKVVEWKQNSQLANLGTIKWDSTSDTPYLYYTSNGEQHVVWFENDSSLALKLQLVSRYRIAGIAFWRLGYENGNFWSVVDNYLNR